MHQDIQRTVNEDILAARRSSFGSDGYVQTVPVLRSSKVEAEAAGTENVIFCTHESDVRLKSLLSVCEPFELGTLPSKTLLDLRLQFPMEPF